MPDIRLTLDENLLAQVDEARGDVARVKWIRRLIEHQFEVVEVEVRGTGEIGDAYYTGPSRSRGGIQHHAKPTAIVQVPARMETYRLGHAFVDVPGSFRCKTCGHRMGEH